MSTVTYELSAELHVSLHSNFALQSNLGGAEFPDFGCPCHIKVNIINLKMTSIRPRIYRTYTDADRKAVVEFYEQHDCKVTALRLIRTSVGYENMTDRKIKRWMSALGIKKCAGRPVCDQFEAEVLAECDKCAQESSKSNYSHRYSYAFVRDCAYRVLNNSYWDEHSSSCTKKWLLDKRTCNLKLTNKWVSGLLRRSSGKRCSAALNTSTSDVKDPMQAQQSHEEVSDISAITYGSFDDFAMDFDWDLLLGDEI